MTAVLTPAGHPCPGGCGRTVPRVLFACRQCWRRLPATLRQAVNHTYSNGSPGAHHAAMAEASQWYRLYPCPASVRVP